MILKTFSNYVFHYEMYMQEWRIVKEIKIQIYTMKLMSWYEINCEGWYDVYNFTLWCRPSKEWRVPRGWCVGPDDQRRPSLRCPLKSHPQLITQSQRPFSSSNSKELVKFITDPSVINTQLAFLWWVMGERMFTWCIKKGHWSLRK